MMGMAYKLMVGNYLETSIPFLAAEQDLSGTIAMFPSTYFNVIFECDFIA